MAGKIYGVGVGVGDPEDLTLKAIKIIKGSDVLVCPRKDQDKCRAYQIVKQVIPEVDEIETISFEFEMIKDEVRLENIYEDIYKTVKKLVHDGKVVTFLTIGDPAIYSTYSYIAERAKKDRVETVSISGISSINACANRLGINLCCGDEQVHIIPNSESVLSALSLPGTKVFMKSGRDIIKIREILLGRDDIDVYAVSGCGTKDEICYRSAVEFPDSGEYMITIIVKEK